MDKPIDHQTVSEHLPALLARELSASDASALEEHLADCEECRAEKQVLELLRATPTDESLTAPERAALERGVMAGIAEETGEHAIVPMRRRTPVGQRVAQVLGAAATIAVLATLVYFGTAGSGGEDSAQSGADGTTASREAPEESRRDGDKVADQARGTAGAGGGSAGSSASQDAALESAAADQGASGFDDAPGPTFRVESDPYTAAELQKRGESSFESVTFANHYSANDAERRLALLEQLVDAARTKAGDAVADQVEQCGRQVLDTDDPTIPTFGSIGRLDGRDVLVLGFAWTRSSSGAFDRYMVWAWERGSCEVAVDFIEGRIETQN